MNIVVYFSSSGGTHFSPLTIHTCQYATPTMMISTPRTMRPYQYVFQSERKTGAMVKEKMVMSLMRMFKAGPEVSLKGSPTVSPTSCLDAFQSVFYTF